MHHGTFIRLPPTRYEESQKLTPSEILACAVVVFISLLECMALALVCWPKR